MQQPERDRVHVTFKIHSSSVNHKEERKEPPQLVTHSILHLFNLPKKTDINYGDTGIREYMDIFHMPMCWLHISKQ
uniref:Uncharacterized protein n=1 Tax=Arundo donax TaxID=35708 RepID=A0A0A9BS24_ARUDO